jgi:ferredoxin
LKIVPLEEVLLDGLGESIEAHFPPPYKGGGQEGVGPSLENRNPPLTPPFIRGENHSAQIPSQVETPELLSAILKDEDRCIRCALCVMRCPVEAIDMERVVFQTEWRTE